MICKRKVSYNENNNLFKKMFMGQKQFHINFYFFTPLLTRRSILNDSKLITNFMNYILSNQVVLFFFSNQFI